MDQLQSQFVPHIGSQHQKWTAFDTLSFPRHLKEHGFTQAQAEAMTDAAGTYIFGELVTREELRQALDTQTLRLTVRMGVMIAVGVAILGTFQALMSISFGQPLPHRLSKEC
jgi:hypothetical protein